MEEYSLGYKQDYLINRFFSRNTMRNLIQNKKDPVFEYVSRNGNVSSSNLSVIQNTYIQLSKFYRNEYFYKNTLLNKLLLGIHSINTTTALTEIPVGNAKPDFILINGKAVVYEIKTELDNFDRLENQIIEYYKAFNHVAIVTHEKNSELAMEKIKSLKKPIGLYILQKNNRIKTVIKPKEYNKDLDRNIIFKILRKGEYENIIKKYFGQLPQVSQFDYYEASKELTMNIPMEQFYLEFLVELKKRSQINQDLFAKVPYELKFLVYFMGFKSKDFEALELFLQK